MTAAVILTWIIVGGVAGLLASLVVRGSGLGIIGDILAGIVGAIIGGVLSTSLGGPAFTGFNWTSLVVAFVGAVILLLIVRLATGGSRRRSRFPL